MFTNNFEAVNGGTEPTTPPSVPVNKEIIMRVECIETDPFEQENRRSRNL